MSIGELARRAGLRPSAIRYYESIGLLEAPARVSGKRRYEHGALQRLSVIAAAQDAGLTLEEIAELFLADDEGEVSARLQDIAREKLPGIDALIARASAVRAWLEAAAECRAHRFSNVRSLTSPTDHERPNLAATPRTARP